MKQLALLLCLIIIVNSASSQSIALNNSGASGDASAVVDISSTTQGLLIPRMTQTERQNITSPATGLFVYQTNGTVGLYYNVGTPGSPDWKYIVNDGLGLNGSTGYTIRHNGSGWEATYALYINASGKVGIGNTNPSYPLDIRTTTGDYGLSHTDGAVVLSTYVGSAGHYGGGIGTQTNHPFFIYTNNAGAKVTVMTSGKVGIGVTSPNTGKLEVLESTGFYSTYSTNTYTGNQDHYGVYGKSVNNPGYGYGVYGEGGFYGVYGLANGTSYTGGVMGVYGSATGSSSGTRYGVYGTASGGTTNYGVNCAGNGGYTGSWSLVSDRKFKENIQPMTSVLEKIMRLKPVTYTLKRKEYSYMNFPEGKQLGLIAQDLEEVFPELVVAGAAPVNTDPKTKRSDQQVEYKGINYIGFAPVLIQAIREQQEIINSLKANIGSAYSGNITTDANGNAVVQLPSGIDTERATFKYQLTVIGQFAQAMIAEEVNTDHRFRIRTDHPNVKISWQVIKENK